MDGIQGIDGSGNSGGHSESMIADKSLFRIGEVSRVTSTKPFVLRYWETEFPMLQPVKSPKGHRLYRREDIDTVFTIKRLLYDEGFTIAGARRHLRDQALGADASNGGAMNADADEGASFRMGGTGETGETGRHSAESALRAASPDLAMLNRKTLLELRDSLRSLLTALESE
jgi:DNA-binding transcriptional MerR regulator